MASTEELQQRVKQLEGLTGRLALQISVLGYIAERFIAEQLSDMSEERAGNIIAQLTNPYTFNMVISGQGEPSPEYRRDVADAATKLIEERMGSIVKRSSDIRKAKIE